MGIVALDIIYLSLYFYSMTTRVELNYHGATLFVLGAIFFSFELFMIFTRVNFNLLLLLSLLLGVLAFYVIYITQTTVTGVKSRYLNEDWISGTVFVYFEIILMLF